MIIAALWLLRADRTSGQIPNTIGLPEYGVQLQAIQGAMKPPPAQGDPSGAWTPRAGCPGEVAGPPRALSKTMDVLSGRPKPAKARPASSPKRTSSARAG